MARWILVLTWLLGIFGLLGNGLVIYLMAVKKRLHSSTNAFIASLAVADFCVAFFTILFSYVRDDFSGYQGRRIFASLHYFLFYSSACNLCVVTADRFVAIALPLRYINFITWRRVPRLILAAWIVPFVICLLPLTWIFSSSPKTKNICDKLFIAFLLTCFEFFPCVVMVMATWRVLCISRRHTRRTMTLQSQLQFNHPKLNFDALREHRERNMSSTKLITIVVGLFVLCYISEMSSSLLHLLNVSKQFWGSYFNNDVRFLFLVANSAVNPFVYAFLKRDIKTELKRFLYRGCFQLSKFKLARLLQWVHASWRHV
ncbi:adenosine receptor A2b-like [Oculina patagonica]